MALVAAPRRRPLAVALAAILIATLTAGSCQSHDTAQPAQHPGDEVSYEELPATPNGSDDPHNRQNLVPVPKGTSPRAVEFADPNTGYALFSSCISGQACQVGLVLTLDGGGSWVSRKLPFDDATDVDMRLGRGNVLIIKAAPDGYFISRDTGRTFQQRPLSPPPIELNLAEAQFSVGCQDLAASGCPDPQPWQTGDNGQRTALPSRPSGGRNFTGLAAAADGTLWLSAQAPDAGSPPGVTISVWNSTDQGRTWHAQGSAHAVDPNVVAHPVVAPDGSDVWLVGARFAARRTPGAGSGWSEANTMREVAEVFSAEVLPGGVLLVASGQGVWLVDPQQRTRDPGARVVFRLRRLDAVTILGYPAQQSGEVWLCAVQSHRCDWSRVAVSAR